MSIKTSDFFVQRLKEWGVTRIYGYPGDGINGVLGAIQRANKNGDGIEFIQVRHEEMAAFMAAGHAKFTGEPGVCLLPVGQVRRICSPGFMMQRWITHRLSPSPDRLKRRRAAPAISRK